MQSLISQVYRARVYASMASTLRDLHMFTLDVTLALEVGVVVIGVVKDRSLDGALVLIMFRLYM